MRFNHFGFISRAITLTAIYMIPFHVYAQIQSSPNNTVIQTLPVVSQKTPEQNGWLQKAQISSSTPVTEKTFLSKDGKSSGHAIINHSTPISHQFNPQLSPDVWITPLPANGESYDPDQDVSEMPLPSGINEKLRREVDAERSAFNQKKKTQNRGIFNDDPSKEAQISNSKELGINLPAGGGTPNDNHIAVGNDGKFISVMNTVIRSHKEDGTINRAFSLSNFALTNTTIDTIPKLDRTFDPRVVYDPVADRYIVIFMQGTTHKNSIIVIGFSTTNDPSKTWNVYKIPGTPIADTIWSDYPIVSQTEQDVFFTLNLLANGSSWEEGFREAVIWQFNKSDGFEGKALRKTFYHNLKYENVPLWSICPMQNSPMPSGPDNYFITVRPYSKQNDSVFLHRVSLPISTGSAEWSLTALKSPIPYGFPPSALQPDTAYKLRTNDARVLSGVRIGNEIHYFQNSTNFATKQAHIMHGTIHRLPSVNRRMTTVDPEFLNAPFITAKLFAHDSFDLGYPAVAAAKLETGKDGTFDPSMLVTTVFSSPWHFPSTGVFYINRYGEYSKYYPMRKGDSLIYYNFIPKGEQRWGDYEGIQAKFNEPGVFYAVGSYGGKNLSMFAYVSKIKINDTVYNNPISSIQVFPIPATEKLQIEFQLKQATGVVGFLYDAKGNAVGSTTGSKYFNDTTSTFTHFVAHGFSPGTSPEAVNYDPGMAPCFYVYCEPGTHRFAVHTSHLAPGIYYLKVVAEGANFGLGNTNEFKRTIIIE